MKVLTRTAWALALLASSAGLAHAQDHGQRGERGDRDGRWGPSGIPAQPVDRERPRGPEMRAGEPPAVRVAPPTIAPPVAVRRDGHDGDRMDGRRGNGWDDRRGWEGRDRNDNRNWRDNDHSWRRDDRNVRRGWDWDDRRDWSWRNRDNDNWRWRSQNRYHGWNYRPPVGYYAHSWIFGDLLPRSWWAPDYRIGQWWSYGLPRPPVGSEWVRVGDDALLIDRYTGRVHRVVYDVFW